MAAVYGIAAPTASGASSETLADRGRLLPAAAVPDPARHSTASPTRSTAASAEPATCCALSWARPAVIPADLRRCMPGQTNRQLMDTHDRRRAAGVPQRHDQPARLRVRALRRHGSVPGHRENGASLPIDSSGSYPFVDGTKTFSGAPELMQRSGQRAAGPPLLREEDGQLRVAARHRRRATCRCFDSWRTTSMASDGSIKQMVL